MTLSAQSLTKRYGAAPGYVAVRGASVELQPGEFISIVGRSGSGKSTLMAMLGALTQPTEGRLLFDGTDVWTLSDLNGTVLASARPGDPYSLIPPPPRTSSVTARRHGGVTRIGFRLSRPFDGQTMFFVLAHVHGDFSWEKVVRTGLRYGASSGSWFASPTPCGPFSNTCISAGTPALRSARK